MKISLVALKPPTLLFDFVQENSHLWLLGDPSLTFTASAVFDHHKKSLSATVCHTATTRQPGRKDTLITWSADAPAGTLANIAQRSSLPGRAHSLHPLTSAIPPANDQADDAAATPADASMYVVPQQRYVPHIARIPSPLEEGATYSWVQAAAWPFVCCFTQQPTQFVHNHFRLSNALPPHMRHIQQPNPYAAKSAYNGVQTE